MKRSVRKSKSNGSSKAVARSKRPPGPIHATPQQIDIGTFIGYQNGGMAECFWMWSKDPDEEYWIMKTGVGVGDFSKVGPGATYGNLEIVYLGSAAVAGTTPAQFKQWVQSRANLSSSQIECRKHACSDF